jgi:hypothetical protein
MVVSRSARCFNVVWIKPGCHWREVPHSLSIKPGCHWREVPHSRYLREKELAILVFITFNIEMLKYATGTYSRT